MPQPVCGARRQRRRITLDKVEWAQPAEELQQIVLRPGFVLADRCAGGTDAQLRAFLHRELGASSHQQAGDGARRGRRTKPKRALPVSAPVPRRRPMNWESYAASKAGHACAQRSRNSPNALRA